MTASTIAPPPSTQGTQGTVRTPSTLEAWHCPARTPAESQPEYASRVLRYALAYGVEPLTLAQLELADAQAQRHVCALPSKLDVDGTRLDATLHALRHRIAAQMVQRRRQQAQDARTLAALAPTPPDDLDTPGGPGEAPEAPQSDQARALRLLKAALTLIMGPEDDQDGGGGRPARLQPPGPTRPPQGQAVPLRPTPPKDGIAF